MYSIAVLPEHAATQQCRPSNCVDYFYVNITQKLFVCVCKPDLLQALPLLTEKQYVSAVHSRLVDGRPWKLPGLQAVCRLAWALALHALSQLPQGSALAEFTEADEALADQALLGGVFLFMTEGMLGCEGFTHDEFYTRRLHSLITDFLALMPMKVRNATSFNLWLCIGVFECDRNLNIV